MIISPIFSRGLKMFDLLVDYFPGTPSFGEE